MKYYVVGEEELGDLVSAARLHSDDLFNEFKALFDTAEAACRARVVPEWATHFAKLYGPNWLVGYVQEIKK